MKRHGSVLTITILFLIAGTLFWTRRDSVLDAATRKSQKTKKRSNPQDSGFITTSTKASQKPKRRANHYSLSSAECRE